MCSADLCQKINAIVGTVMKMTPTPIVKKLYEIPLLFQDGMDALEEHKHRKHLQNGMLTETLHREKKGILGLKGLTRTGSNLKNITKKKGGLFSKIQTGTQSDHHRENTGMEANLKHQKHFRKITNSLNFLTSTLDNSFAHVNAMIKQQKLLLEPLAKMATNNYHELIGVLDIYGKKHEAWIYWDAKKQDILGNDTYFHHFVH